METTATPATGIPATGTRGRFVWHELMTSDPAAAQAFYKEVIGWGTMPMTVPGGEGEYTMWMAGEVPVGGVMAFTPDARIWATRSSTSAADSSADVSKLGMIDPTKSRP